MFDRDKVVSEIRRMSMQRQAATAHAERELTEAVHRVHEQYGSDLKSFFRDVLERSKSAQQSEPTIHPSE
jgi:hypothetical protein